MTSPPSCPTCLQQNLTSTLQDLGNTTTLLGFFPFHDAQGRSHSQNPNRVANPSSAPIIIVFTSLFLTLVGAGGFRKVSKWLKD